MAFLWTKGKFTPPRKGAALCRGLLTHFPALEARLRYAPTDAHSRSQGIGPLAHGTEGVSWNRCLYLGDALGYADGITGEGLSAAFAQAEALGARLPGLIDIGRLDAESLRPLGSELKNDFR